MAEYVASFWDDVFTALCVNEQLDRNVLQRLFDGTVAGPRAELVSRCIRFAVLLSFTASVGLAPELDDPGAFMDFLHDQSQHLVLSSTDPNLSAAVEQTQDYVITMTIFQTDPEIIRYSRSDVEWGVFELERECVRAYWANEAKNLLFDEITSAERLGIQFDSHTLRNITNQSSNQPIGYPVVLSNVTRSLSKY
jgi:hypothetical protein